MKKLFFVAALGVAGVLSASNNVQKTQKESFTITSDVDGGYCTVDVYRINRDGSSTYIGSWGGYADSQEACNAKGNSIVALLSMGIAPADITF